MAKRVRISVDSGSSWATLPGNTASISNEAGEIDDTIFGQDFESIQSGLIGWTVEANALYKGFAGYVGTIKKSGTPTNMSAEAMQLVSGKTYRVTNAAKRTLNRSAVITVLDNGNPVNAANIASIDHLFGRVTFAGSYTPTTPVAITTQYLPLANVGKVRDFTLTQTANAIDKTTRDEANVNEGHREFGYGLKSVSVECSGVYDASNGFLDLLAAREELILEINPDGQGKSVAKGFFKPSSTGSQGDVGDLEEETITFSLSVPDDESVEVPFKWLHASDTTLNQAVVDCLESWQNSTPIMIAYLPDGVAGVEGEAVITDMTMESPMEGMNEFTVNVQGSGALDEYT